MPDPHPLSPPPVLLEACVTTPAEAVRAVRGGADRLELCRDLEAGGLTPDPRILGETRSALERAGLGGTPVHCMVRPVPGPFVADGRKLATMVTEVRILRERGAHGLVLGTLTAQGAVDLEALGTLVETAGDLPVTFHRAFDHVPDPLEALECLGELGVARVLTGGGPGTAWDGRDTLAALVAASHGAPKLPRILGAGGIRGDHVLALLRHTGLPEIHARASAYPALARAIRDPSRDD